MTEQDYELVEEALGHRFADRSLIERALTHASLVDDRLRSNERLEFLGDAVLGLVVCEFLHGHYDELLEGDMTKIKSTVVSRHSCAVIAEQMGLDRFLRLGKGMSNRAQLPQSVIAAVYESVIGAIYLDGGIDAARTFIMGRMRRHAEDAARSGHHANFKSVLQQAAQTHFEETPQYHVLDEKGPDHAKCFEICVEIGTRRFESCWGNSKKQAEQDAALNALVELGFAERTDWGVRLVASALNG